MEGNEPTLQADVAAEFNCTIVPCRKFYKNYWVDLRTIDVETARKLVADGFPYLVEKPKKKSKNATEQEEEKQ